MNNHITMDNLAVALGELEGRLSEIVKEVRRLRVHVRDLEDENHRLRTMIFMPVEEEGGYRKLVKYYEEGFHICPSRFARLRIGNQGCIFCQTFLEKKGLASHE